MCFLPLFCFATVLLLFHFSSFVFFFPVLLLLFPFLVPFSEITGLSQLCSIRSVHRHYCYYHHCRAVFSFVCVCVCRLSIATVSTAKFLFSACLSFFFFRYFFYIYSAFFLFLESLPFPFLFVFLFLLLLSLERHLDFSLLLVWRAFTLCRDFTHFLFSPLFFFFLPKSHLFTLLSFFFLCVCV